MRKIIGRRVFEIVPVTPGLNGCVCPTIVQIRDVDLEQCHDIKTVFKMHDAPITFRFCKCPEKTGCKKLPPFDPADNMWLGAPVEERWFENGRGLFFET